MFDIHIIKRNKTGQIISVSNPQTYEKKVFHANRQAWFKQYKWNPIGQCSVVRAYVHVKCAS